MGTLINPTRPSPQAEADFNAEPTYLRNPTTGMIFKLYHKDSIQRCLREFYMPSSAAEMREQAVELAELQGRPLVTTAAVTAEPSESDPGPAIVAQRIGHAAGKR